MADSCGASREALLSEGTGLRYDEIVVNANAQTDPWPLARGGSDPTAVAAETWLAVSLTTVAAV
jgi:hypothetical protein